MADVVAPPSRDTPESNRREILVVDKPTSGLNNRDSVESSFGPMITMGEPFCKRDSGSNPPGVLTLPVSDDLQFSDNMWAICPTVHSALFGMIKAATINITLITNNSCQSHDRYQQHLENPEVQNGVYIGHAS